MRHYISHLSLIHGWLPAAATGCGGSLGVGDRLAVTALENVGLPVMLLGGVVLALWAHWYIGSLGVAGDPAPSLLWIWIAATGLAVGVLILGWRGAQWWRRGVSVLAVPMCVLSAALAVNLWVGYFPTVHTAWNQLTAGPCPTKRIG